MIAHAPFRVGRAGALAALVALASSPPAVAQTQLHLLMSGFNQVVWNPECQPWDYAPECWLGVIPHPGRVIQFDVDRRQIVATTPISHALGTVIGPRTTPDGRFLLWSGSSVAAQAPYHVGLFDIARRQQATLFVASGVSVVPLAVHPAEMRAFLGLSPAAVTVAEPGGTYTLPSPPCALPSFSGRSGDGRRLSFGCADPHGVVVVDSGDGHVIGTVPHAVTSHLLDDAGTTVFGVSWARENIETPVFQRFDVATGAVLAERQAAVAGFNGSLWHYNPATGHLYVGSRSGILVLDANTLQEVGRIPTPDHSLPYVRMAIDPDRPEAYIGWYGTIDHRNVLRVSLVHTGTLATIGSYDIPVDGRFVGMALGPRPPPVSDLGIVVVSHLATLTWTVDTSRSMATEQVVEVGFAPGETALRLGVAAGAISLSVPGVPPGRYYVRIRSVNGTGIGSPSNEVLVTVP